MRVQIGDCRFPLHVPHDDIDAGRRPFQLGHQHRQEHRESVGRADREAARRRRRIERRSGRNDVARPRKDIGDRLGQFGGAGGWNHALRRSQEQRIVEQPTQPAKPMTDSGRRKPQPFGRTADVTFLQHHLEQCQQVEVGSRQVSLVQHIREIISLDSAPANP